MNKKVYVMLSMTGTRFSVFLRLVTRKKYTHVSISLDSDLNELYSFGRRNLYFPLISGFVKESPDAGVFKCYDTACVIYEIQVSDKKYLDIKERINEFNASYDEYRYNFGGLPLMFFDIPLHRKRHFVCSQFVAYLLTMSKTVHFSKDYSIIKPGDFLKISKMRLIYEGKLQNYSHECFINPEAS